MKRGPKLKAKQVLQIVKFIGRGWPFGRIAEKFGVTIASIDNIDTGKTWSSVAGR